MIIRNHSQADVKSEKNFTNFVLPCNPGVQNKTMIAKWW